MGKIIIVVFLVLTAAIAGIFLISDHQQDTDMLDKTTKVGVILNGSRDDRSFCQSHYMAMESIRDELKLDIVYRENVPDDCYDEIVRLIRDEKCEIIIGVSFGYGEAMQKAAAAYPDNYFLHATGLAHEHNLSSFFGRMYQARYLSGIVAGMKTQNGKIGYIAAFPIPEVIRGINAFTLGVRSVRPDADVYVQYCNSWTKDAPANDAFYDLLLKHHIDVISLHTDSLQPHLEAEMRGVWSVGYNMDNAELFPKTYLTACVWKWDVFYRQEITKCLQGKFHGRNVWMKLEDGIVSLSNFTPHVANGTIEAVQIALSRLRSREFDVFYGPVRDNEGNLRIEAGESMSDDEMLNGFDWYVEGVHVEQ